MVGGKSKKAVETTTHSTHSQGLEELKAIFPNWSEEDLKAELQVVNNDFNAAVDRISSGQAEQWEAVGKKQKQKKSEPEPEQKKKDSTESHTNGSSSRGRGRGGASNTGTRGGLSGRGRSDKAAPSPTRDHSQPARGTGRPTRGRPEASASRPSEVVVVTSQDWDADTTTPAAPAAAPTAISTAATSTIAAAPAPAVNSWSNPIPPWSKPAVTHEAPQPVVEASPAPAAPVVIIQEQSAPAPTQAAQPAASEPQQSSYQFAAKPQAAQAPAPASITSAPQQPQAQPHSTQQPQSQPQTQPAVTAPVVNPQAHIQQTSLRMPPTLVPTLEDVERTLHDQYSQPRMGGFAQKDNSPVVLPNNAAIQGLNLRFGSLGLGVEEPTPAVAPAAAAAAPSVPQQNGTPAAQPISTDKSTERAPPAGFSHPQKAPEAHQKPQAQRTEGAEAAYPGTTPDQQAMYNQSYMQNMTQYGMPYGFYDGLDVNMQTRMLYYDPAFQHSQHFQAPPVKGNYGKADPSGQSPQAVPPQSFPVQYPPHFFPYYPVPGQYPFQQNVGYGNPFPPHNKSPYYKGGQGQQYGAFPQTYNNNASNGQPQTFGGQGEELEQSPQAAPQTTHQSKFYSQSGVKGGSNVGGSEGGYKGNNYDRQRQNQPNSYYQGPGQGQSHQQGYYGQGQGQGQNYPRFWNQQN